MLQQLLFFCVFSHTTTSKERQKVNTMKRLHPGTHSLVRYYLLDAEFADGVVHQNHCVFYRHSDVPVCPTALVRPVLGTLALKCVERVFTLSTLTKQCIRSGNSLSVFHLEKKGQYTVCITEQV